MENNNYGLFGGYGGRLERHLTDVARRFADRVHEDPSFRSIIVLFIISFTLIAFLILFIGLFLVVGCVCVFSYFFMAALSALADFFTGD